MALPPAGGAFQEETFLARVDASGKVAWATFAGGAKDELLVATQRSGKELLLAGYCQGETTFGKITLGKGSGTGCLARVQVEQ